jgi:hypothetical protein
MHAALSTYRRQAVGLQRMGGSEAVHHRMTSAVACDKAWPHRGGNPDVRVIGSLHAL